MNQNINSLPEAIQAILAGADYLERLMGKSGQEAPGRNGAASAPHGMAAQVTEILKQSGRPMMPKEIAARHQQLGWPAPDGGWGKLYESVTGAIAYLGRKKKMVARVPDGYVLKGENFAGDKK